MGDTVLGLLRRDEGKPHRLCFAKNVVACFRVSRPAVSDNERLAVRVVLKLQQQAPASSESFSLQAPPWTASSGNRF
jgi:hypothetical protein